MELEDLVGKHKLSGVELGTMMVKTVWDEEKANYVKFRLDDVNYIAVEDPDDGYRSYMRDIHTCDEDPDIRFPEVDVLCRMHDSDDYGEHEVLDFIDLENGEVILSVGTRNTDDYYPYAVFEYHPENIHYNH